MFPYYKIGKIEKRVVFGHAGDSFVAEISRECERRPSAVPTLVCLTKRRVVDNIDIRYSIGQSASTTSRIPKNLKNIVSESNGKIYSYAVATVSFVRPAVI